MRYERCKLPVVDGVCDVPGRIVEVLEAPQGGRNQITALVEVPSEPSATTTIVSAGDTSERVVDVQREMDRDLRENPKLYQALADDETPDERTVYCQGTNADDSPCSREVGEPGDTCWQHPEE